MTLALATALLKMGDLEHGSGTIPVGRLATLNGVVCRCYGRAIAEDGDGLVRRRRVVNKERSEHEFAGTLEVAFELAEIEATMNLRHGATTLWCDVERSCNAWSATSRSYAQVGLRPERGAWSLKPVMSATDMNVRRVVSHAVSTRPSYASTPEMHTLR